jgi:hypothetical protein
MTTAGWILMLSSVFFVWALTIWCYYKLLTRRRGTPGSDDDAST